MLYTIGYANKEKDAFIALLKRHLINCVVDVRSSPYSHQFADYNRENLSAELNEHGIYYLFFGNEFGARREEDDVYSKVNLFDGYQKEIVDFNKVWELDIFKSGVARIVSGLNKGYNICFMCSEKNPYDCHRCVMVSEYFFRNNHNIKHIIDEKTCLQHSELCSVDAVSKYYDKCKNIFEKKYYKELAYGFDLFTGENRSVEPEIIVWEQFFKDKSRENIMYLLNLKIGYEKGNNDYD